MNDASRSSGALTGISVESDSLWAGLESQVHSDHQGFFHCEVRSATVAPPIFEPRRARVSWILWTVQPRIQQFGCGVSPKLIPVPWPRMSAGGRGHLVIRT